MLSVNTLSADDGPWVSDGVSHVTGDKVVEGLHSRLGFNPKKFVIFLSSTSFTTGNWQDSGFRGESSRQTSKLSFFIVSGIVIAYAWGRLW